VSFLLLLLLLLLDCRLRRRALLLRKLLLLLLLGTRLHGIPAAAASCCASWQRLQATAGCILFCQLLQERLIYVGCLQGVGEQGQQTD